MINYLLESHATDEVIAKANSEAFIFKHPFGGARLLLVRTLLGDGM